jgi:glycosyltransferase involved in cell wall biosynthesis
MPQAAVRPFPVVARSPVEGEALEPATLELTILMPCLNEAETIEVCVRKAKAWLDGSGVTGEVLVADNGSRDGSQALAEACGARVVPIPEKGYGAALIGGIRAARGKYVIMGDADDSYDFSRLDAFVDKLQDGADLVMGNRFKGGIDKGAMPPLHYWLGNPVLSFLGRLLFNIPIGDFHCGLRGFNRDAILALGLKSPGMEFASEMVVKASLAKVRMEEVPTTLKKDGRSRPPHLKTWRDGWRHLKFLLLHSPKWMFVYPGVFLLALGLFGSILLAPGAVAISPTVQIDIHSLVAACFAVVIGTQLIMFGALARRYAMIEGVLPDASSFKKTLLGMELEPILRVAGVILALGLVGAGVAVSRWAGAGFGPIIYNDVMRMLVISLTAITVAIQIGAAGVLASMLNIRR